MTTRTRLRQYQPLTMKRFDNNDHTNNGGGSWYDVNKEELQNSLKNSQQQELLSMRLGFQRDM
jgi:N-methylhydantoinase B/oxoprolinase/acetone carboxylase alpha subunit